MKSPGLEIRKVPDKSSGTRLVRFDPETGERKLINPETPGDDHESWPLLGVEIAGKIPEKSMLSQSYVAAARDEGWLEVTGEKLEFKPGGPASNPWGTTHTFIHLNTITIKTLDGDVKLNVVRQPDKYDVAEELVSERGGEKDMVKSTVSGKPTDKTGDPETTVDWFYVLEVKEDSRSGDIVAKGEAVHAMADFQFNRMKGRLTQLVEEIRASSAYANSALIISLWRRGSATDAALKDYDDVAALEGDAQAAELTSGVNANYARKTIIDTTPTITYDDTNEWVDIDIPDQTWTSLGAGGTAITDLLVSVDLDTGAGTDSNQIPGTFHAFSVTPDGSDVTAQVPTNGFFRSS